MGQVHPLHHPDITTARRFFFCAIARDELYEDPFNRRAQRRLLKLIVDDSPRPTPPGARPGRDDPLI